MPRKCKCGEPFSNGFVFDTGGGPSPQHAFNLDGCGSCGMICKESVWENPGITWIHVDGKIETEPLP